MSVPTHRSSCKTSTSPIACWDCNTRVFRFRCTCGSFVLFKKLGGDWEKHDCRLPLRRETESISVHLRCRDYGVLEFAVFRIAEIAKATEVGMRIPALIESKKARRTTGESLLPAYRIRLINPSEETMKRLRVLDLPLSVSIVIDPIAKDAGGTILEKTALLDRARSSLQEKLKKLERRKKRGQGSLRVGPH